MIKGPCHFWTVWKRCHWQIPWVQWPVFQRVIKGKFRDKMFPKCTWIQQYNHTQTYNIYISSVKHTPCCIISFGNYKWWLKVIELLSEDMYYYTLWCLKRDKCLLFHTWPSYMKGNERSNDSLLDQTFLQVYRHASL